MIKNWFRKFQPKVLIAVLLAALILREWRKGYFTGLSAYCRTFLFKRYLFFSLLVAGVTSLFFFIDPPLLGGIQALDGPFLQAVVSFGSFLGRGVNFWTILIGLYWAFLLLKKTEWNRKVLGALVASLLTSLVCQILKFTMLRARPYAGAGPFSFFNLEGLTADERTFQSLPSGDVALVAGAAAYLIFAFEKNRLKWLWILIPAATAVARVWLNRHWPSDTFLSLGIGFLMAHWFWRFKKSEAPA